MKKVSQGHYTAIEFEKSIRRKEEFRGQTRQKAKAGLSDIIKKQEMTQKNLYKSEHDAYNQLKKPVPRKKRRKYGL